MVSSAVLRAQIEAALAARVPAVFRTPAPVNRPVIPTGIASLDHLLNGGFPVGTVSEVTGPESSGRTTLALSFLARVMQGGDVCAWIDVGDTLDPESAAAVGIDLARLLWVRCSDTDTGHPQRKPWSRLDQALRATDLVLQAGGFSAVVFDMGGIAQEHALRVPLASWFRFRQAAERTQSTFLLLTQVPCAKSCASVSLRTDRSEAASASTTVLDGFRFHATLLRQRNHTGFGAMEKKPPASDHATWMHRMSWAGEQ
jgi:recombination protein RecA